MLLVLEDTGVATSSFKKKPIFLVVSNIWKILSISYMGCHPSHWRTHIFSEGLKPPTRYMVQTWLEGHFLLRLFSITGHSWPRGLRTVPISLTKCHIKLGWFYLRLCLCIFDHIWWPWWLLNLAKSIGVFHWQYWSTGGFSSVVSWPQSTKSIQESTCSLILPSSSICSHRLESE